MSEELVKRLLQLAGNTGKMTWVDDKPMTASDALRKAADCLKAQAAEIARLREACHSVIDRGFDHYTARNGRQCSIEGDDGEKCWIIPFETFEDVRAALKGADNATGE